MLGTEASGEPALLFNDSGGRRRSILHVQKDASSWLRFFDDEQATRLLVGHGPEGPSFDVQH